MTEPIEDGEDTQRIEKLLEPIKTLAHRCLQWEHGEIKGFDTQMMDSLLPLTVQPLIREHVAQERERIKKIISDAGERSFNEDYRFAYKLVLELINIL